MYEYIYVKNGFLSWYQLMTRLDLVCVYIYIMTQRYNIIELIRVSTVDFGWR